MDARPGLQLVQTLVTISGPGNASLANAWSTMYGFQDAVVWADTTDYIYQTWMSQAPFNNGYPGSMVIDIDTMTLTYASPGGPMGATSAIQTILDNAHECAEI
jgi:hypothetical protein